MPDFLIKNGTVIDGSGSKRYKADVAIKGDKIEAIERNINLSPNGCRIIDATGKVVCPGIVDSHSHADMTMHRKGHYKLLAPLIKQGITTFIGGNCGMAMAPLGDDHYEELKVYLEGFTARQLGQDVSWKSMGEFMDHVEKQGLVMNAAMLAPHGILRIDAMGMDTRAARNDEIQHMEKALDECMEAGTIGLSTGLQYMPGLQCDTEELVRLGKVLKKYDGIYASHLRSYMSTLPQAVDEIVKISRVNDIRGQISHIFWVPDMGVIGPIVRKAAQFIIEVSKYWTLPAKLDTEIEKLVNRLNKIRRNVNIGMDVMPTTTTFTHLMAYFPPWAIQGSKQEIGRRMLSRSMRKKMLRDIDEGRLIWPHTGQNSWSLNIFKILGWECTRIMSVVTEKNKHLEGRTMAEIANERGIHPFDLACDLMVEEEGRVLVFSSLGEPEDSFTEQSLFAALKSPDVSISTDTILMGIGKPSHLFYGAYPKFLSRYVRDMKMMSLETGVRKITGLPAEHFNLKNRGLLKKDWYADVLVFDPVKIEPNVDFNHPVGDPKGIHQVFINGQLVVNEKEFNPTPLPGKLLRR